MTATASLLAALELRARVGWTVDLVDPLPTGQVDASEFVARIRPETAFVSLMQANNETGVIQPVAKIGRAIRRIAPGALFHVDATQVPGRLASSFDDDLADVDFLSISAHKFHGPKGIGALFVADGRVPALIHGSQESGQRGGTLNTAGAAGLAAAAKLARIRIGEMDRVRALRDSFEQGLREQIGSVQILGDEAERLPNTSAFSLPGIDALEVVDALARDGIVIASGAACASGATAPSHVLTAMGLDYAHAKRALRVSLSRLTTEVEIEAVIERICDVARVRA
jgi:cysteine desulfurase